MQNYATVMHRWSSKTGPRLRLFAFIIHEKSKIDWFTVLSVDCELSTNTLKPMLSRTVHYTSTAIYKKNNPNREYSSFSGGGAPYISINYKYNVTLILILHPLFSSSLNFILPSLRVKARSLNNLF